MPCEEAKEKRKKKKRLMTIFMRRYLWLDPTETADSRRILAGSPRRHATMCWGKPPAGAPETIASV